MCKHRKKRQEREVYLIVTPATVLNNFEQELQVTGMAGSLIVLPVVAIGEDFLLPFRQGTHLFIFLNFTLENQERKFMAATVGKSIRKSGVKQREKGYHVVP